MRLADVSVSSRPARSRFWWLRAICFALMALVLFATLARPMLTLHPHVDLHEGAAHHAGQVSSEEQTFARVLEAVCLSIDGCHQLGTWLHLAGSSLSATLEANGSFPRGGARFTSASLAGLLRPPNPLAAVPSDEWVSSSFCEVA